jgi:hypothetical protein
MPMKMFPTRPEISLPSQKLTFRPRIDWPVRAMLSASRRAGRWGAGRFTCASGSATAACASGRSTFPRATPRGHEAHRAGHKIPGLHDGLLLPSPCVTATGPRVACRVLRFAEDVGAVVDAVEVDRGTGGAAWRVKGVATDRRQSRASRPLYLGICEQFCTDSAERTRLASTKALPWPLTLALAISVAVGAGGC